MPIYSRAAIAGKCAMQSFRFSPFVVVDGARCVLVDAEMPNEA